MKRIRLGLDAEEKLMIRKKTISLKKNALIREKRV
jgi:hypothetical protein